MTCAMETSLLHEGENINVSYLTPVRIQKYVANIRRESHIRAYVFCLYVNTIAVRGGAEAVSEINGW